MAQMQYGTAAPASQTLAQAARARTMTPEQKLQRSGELAEIRHLVYRARMHAVNEQGERVFSAPSGSQPGLFHIVRLTPTGEWVCGCPAGEHGLPCGHVGAALHLWRQVEAAMSEAGMRAQRAYEAFGAWLEERGY